MSCPRCEAAQDNPTVSCFFRWKNANVELRGCDEHLREVMVALRHVQGDEQLMKHLSLIAQHNTQ